MLPTFLQSADNALRRFPSILFPFFFAVYPILALRNANLTYVEASELIRPLLTSALLTAVMWILLRPITLDWKRAGILTSFYITLLLVYGHVFLQLQILFGDLVRHRYVVLACLILAVAAWLLVRRLKDPRDLVTVLFSVGLALVAFASFQSVAFDLKNMRSAAAAVQGSRNENVLEPAPEDQALPDIYWILLDGHSGSRVMKERFGHDDSAFVAALQDMGFYVAGCSQSNYPVTKYSVNSFMNASYLTDIPGVSSGLAPLYSSLAVQTVRSMGYTVITFETRSKGHFAFQEDMRLSRNQLALGTIDLFGGPSEFETMLVTTSVLRLVYDMPQLVPGLNPHILQETEFYEHFQQVHFILDKLPNLPKTDAPKFVFAHLLVPHQPYIFTPDGEFFWALNDVDGYRSNVQFIDAAILPVLREIIAESTVPPIIILQGDHGSSIGHDPEVRMSILNAYYVKDEARADLYPAISPVNTFRIIANHYFGANYPLLEDVSYLAFGEGEVRAQSKVVPNACDATQ